jgi:RNA polymerase sigma-70 factor, ECF subfamily
VSDSELKQIHQDLLAGDPEAPRRLVSACQGRLHSILKRKYAYLPREAVEDAVNDALLALIGRPERYDPGRGSLMNLLVHVGANKLKDHLRALVRREWEIAAGGPVELERLEANNAQEDAGKEADPEGLSPEVEELLQQLLPEPEDRRVWDLVCAGRTSVEEFSAALEIVHLPCEERKREVKRHRDRVIKKVQRRREDFRKYLL